MLAEVKGRVSWSELQELAVAFADAKAAFVKVGLGNTGNVQEDLERMTVIKRFEDAGTVYRAALKRYQEQTK